jgi:hypothetical protein
MQTRGRKWQLVHSSICAWFCKAQLTIRDAAEERGVLLLRRLGSRETRKETKDEVENDNNSTSACAHCYCVGISDW